LCNVASRWLYLKIRSTVSVIVVPFRNLMSHDHSAPNSRSLWLNLKLKVLLEKLTGSQLVKKFHIFYGTRNFITTFTNVCHLSLFWASSIHSMPPHLTAWRSIL